MGWFAFGSVAGGIATGFLLVVLAGLLDPLPSTMRVLLAICVALLTALVDLHLWDLRLPGAMRQVPETVMRDRPIAGPMQFGFEMGTGARTYMTAGAPIAVAAAMLLGLPGPLTCVAMGATFGVARGLVPTAMWMSANREMWFDRLDRYADQGTYATITAIVPLVVLSALVIMGL